MEGETSGSIGHYISARDHIHLNAEVPDGLEPSKPLALAENRSLIYDESVLLRGKGTSLRRCARHAGKGTLRTS
jgi:hypothetical protein